MTTWLDSIMSPLNAAGEGLQKLIETRDLVKFGDTFRKLLAEVLAAQRGALTANANEATLLESIRELKQKIADFETWDREKTRYELKGLRPGFFVYMLKPSERGGNQPHWVCQTCYENGKISIFQWTPDMALNYRLRRCPSCKTPISPYGDPIWMD